MTLAQAAATGSRIRSTPYARRLARERGIPLAAVAGSGPNGRIVADDLARFVPQPAAAPLPPPVAAPSSQPAAVAPLTAPAPALSPAPSALVARVSFAAADALLAQLAAVCPGLTRENLCLRAAALAMVDVDGFDPRGAILHLASADRREFLAGLAHASLGSIDALRQEAPGEGEAAVAISFLARAGIRPVAAQLVGGAPARLMVGAVDTDGAADCLLSYDFSRVGDTAAETYLGAFADLVETPLRLLV
jgi:pyruvate dehydrogenase E2 component (dihydrolipoamide acetyltransferase)